eukprot:GHVH01006078.1.p1 GENE.GHVH01006078.1~~GHVH01006078.1.p1  ORF type:complete len:618 (-),score=84.16 GHVH01006078.1:39-1892(-)
MPMKTVEQEFLERIDSDVTMIEDHFNAELNVFADRLVQIKHELDAIDERTRRNMMFGGEGGNSSESEGHSLSATEKKELDDRKERLAKTIITIWDCFEKLEDYQKMNLLGAAKLFQKRDVIWGQKSASVDFLPFRRRLKALEVPVLTQSLMKVLHQKATKEEDLNFEEAMHVQRAFLKESESADRDDSLTFYFLGVLTVLVFDVFVLLIMKSDNLNFDLELAVSRVMAVWRLSFAVCFFSWTLAFTISIWERYLVNYKFIMNVDTGCNLDSTDIIGLASVQTTVWSLGMIAFLSDYKFNAFGENRYWGIHSVIQLVVQFIVIPLWPATQFRYEYRGALLSSCWRCVASIFRKPTKSSFSDSLSGDMLTSMVKPMVDIFVIVSFLFEGNFLSPAYSDGVIPYLPLAGALIAVGPLLIRIQQNRDKIQCNLKHPKVMANCHTNILKFICSIMVVIVTNLNLDRWLSPYTTRLLWVVTYIVASLMALYWDINKDWGLAADPDNFLRDGERIMFPQYIYMNVVMIDVFGRLTWALTLMPSRILGKGILEQQSVVTIATMIEICRRNAWFLVKIEHEHLTNSNKYRALLWVPKVHAKKDDSIRELHENFISLNDESTSPNPR